MPAMGDSVAEGTVLEWHKQEGDTVAADETLVEISTDKVDAEVPSPVAGTIVKIHAAEGDTVAVGALLAEIATNGDGRSRRRSVRRDRRRPAGPAPHRSPSRRRRPRRPSPAAATEAEGVAAAAGATGELVDIVTPTGGESVTEGTILEWSVKVGDAVKDGDTVVEISTDKVDMELPAPASGRSPRSCSGGRDRHGRPGDRADERPARGGARAGAPAATAVGAPPPTAERHHCVRRDGRNASPVARRIAAQRASTSGRRPGHRPRRADHQGRRARRRQRRQRRQRNGSPPRPPAQTAEARRRAADQGRRGRARALHGREPLDPDRDLVPDADGHVARPAARAAQGRRPPRLVHAPDRVRDRARRDRRHAGDGPPLRRDRRQAPPRRRRRRATSAWRSTSRRRTAPAR